MARAWIVDGKGFAAKVKNATYLPKNQIKDCGASMECPNCYHRIDNSDISSEWPGLPAGVKFDPSDVELVQHLAGKIGFVGTKPHPFIDEFIPTLEGDDGICSTHPENLPGVRRDGTCVHFFHRTIKAYAIGQRKRQKISDELSSTADNGRWHKTGKTKIIMEVGGKKGYKKIMVLYKSSKKNSKADKTPWVRHQYYLGTNEDEEEGEFVVSKVYYKQKDLEEFSILNSPPTTPNTLATNPPRRGKCSFVNEESSVLDQIDENNIFISVLEALQQQIEHPKSEEIQPGSATIEYHDPHAEPAYESTDFLLYFNSQELMNNLDWMN